MTTRLFWALAADAVARFTGFATEGQRHYWSKLAANLAFAGVVSGIGVVFYKVLPAYIGWSAIACGTILAWIGVLLARKSEHSQEE